MSRDWAFLLIFPFVLGYPLLKWLSVGFYLFLSSVSDYFLRLCCARSPFSDNRGTWLQQRSQWQRSGAFVDKFTSDIVIDSHAHVVFSWVKWALKLFRTDILSLARLIYTYVKHNKDLNEALESNTAMNRDGFFKLLVLGLFDIVVTMPLAIVQLVAEAHEGSGGAGFWPGWKTVHSNFSTIPSITSDEWKTTGFWSNFGIRFNQWINPAFALTFFLLFGLTEQKRAWYKSIFWKVMKPFGLRPRVDPIASSIVFDSVPGPVLSTRTDSTQATSL